MEYSGILSPDNINKQINSLSVELIICLVSLIDNQEESRRTINRMICKNLRDGRV